MPLAISLVLTFLIHVTRLIVAQDEFSGFFVKKQQHTYISCNKSPIFNSILYIYMYTYMYSAFIYQDHLGYQTTLVARIVETHFKTSCIRPHFNTCMGHLKIGPIYTIQHVHVYIIYSNAKQQELVEFSGGAAIGKTQIASSCLLFYYTFSISTTS